MAKRELIIVGIDPGTTTAFCITDLEGEVIALHSSKLFDLSKVIEKITDIGRVIAVGCDKQNAPSFVEKVATKIGARLIVPEHDMLLAEKKKLVKIETANTHEFDATACAKFAYNSIKAPLDKIKKFFGTVELNQNEKNEIVELVILKGIGIKLANSIVKKEEETKSIKKIIEEAEDETDLKRIAEISELYEKIKKQEKIITIQKQHSKKLNNEKQKLKKQIGLLEKQLAPVKKDKKVRNLLSHRTDQIETLTKKISTLEQDNQHLKHQLTKQDKILKKANQGIIIKILNNLGSKEFEKNEVLKIVKGDIIYVKNAAIVSSKVLEYLKSRVTYIVYDGNLTKELKRWNFVFIEAKKLSISQSKNFGWIDKNIFEKAKRSSALIETIIKEHRERN